jgi:hypothetical protein
MSAALSEPTPFGEIIVFQDKDEGFDEGDEFELSGWVWSPSAEPLGAACHASLTVRAWGAAGYMGAVDSAVVDTSLRQDEWIALSVRYTVPAGAVLLQPGPMLRVPGTGCAGAIYWEDISFLKVGPL